VEFSSTAFYSILARFGILSRIFVSIAEPLWVKGEAREMKRHSLFGFLCLTLVLVVAAAAWAADQSTALTEDTPAILAALDAGSVTTLDDQTAMAIRGQNGPYEYVLVKILGVNALDYGPGIQWTCNPLGYRYGAFGGPGWSNPGVDPVDPMDKLFAEHDYAYDHGLNRPMAVLLLIAGLKNLATNNNYPYWGLVYYPDPWPTGLTATTVKVSGLSLIGNKFSFWWVPMPYTEYARREALAGMGIVALGRILLQ
jgi:hypothetical protein